MDAMTIEQQERFDALVGQAVVDCTPAVDYEAAFAADFEAEAKAVRVAVVAAEAVAPATNKVTVRVPKETTRQKAERIMAAGGVSVLGREKRPGASDVVTYRVRGDHGTYTVVDRDNGWRCGCRATVAECSHVEAARLYSRIESAKSPGATVIHEQRRLARRARTIGELVAAGMSVEQASVTVGR